jgi:hypothetical protein
MEERTALINELEYRQQSELSRTAARKIIFIFGLIMIIVGLSFLIVPEFYVEFLNNRSYDVSDRYHVKDAVNVKVFGGALSVLASVLFAYLYMVGFSPKQIRKTAQYNTLEISSDGFKNEAVNIVALLKSIDESLEKGKLESALSESERKEVIDAISSAVESNLNESLLNKIEDKYGATIHASKLSELALSSLDKTVKRLSKYADDLKDKAAINLSYGIGATVIAIGTLIYVLFNASAPENATTIQEVFYYSSRLVLVVLVQGISIFFLNLYRTTINNVLYLNNEITNHEAKRDSLSIALSSGNFESASFMLIALSNTERNFTLKKGETSIYDKGSATMQAPISEALVNDLLNKLNPGKSGSSA